MRILSLCLMSLPWLMSFALSAEEREFPLLSLLASDPAEQLVAVLDADRSVKTLKVQESLSGEDWRAELIHVAADGARFAWVDTSGERRSRLELWVALRVAGEQHSEIRVLDPEVRAPNEPGVGTQPPKTAPEIPEGARVYRVSPSQGSIDVTDRPVEAEGG